MSTCPPSNGLQLGAISRLELRFKHQINKQMSLEACRSFALKYLNYVSVYFIVCINGHVVYSVLYFIDNINAPSVKILFFMEAALLLIYTRIFSYSSNKRTV